MRHPVKSAFDGNARFQVRRPLGAGAFGSVYEVFDKHYNTVVALKLLHESRASVLYRFKHEFRLLADLVHPNLVTLYELHSEGEQWFLTMEYVEGRHFSDYIRDTSLLDSITSNSPAEPRELAAELNTPTATFSRRDSKDEETISALVPKSSPATAATPVSPGHASGLRVFSANVERLRAAFFHLAQGVHALHSAGIVHRDLKPSNVIVTPSGRVVVLDFGLAKTLVPTGMDATSEELAGSPPYMAPEQWAGNPASEASDWYSVGVMLFETLAGSRPFSGPTDARLARQRQGVVPPSSLVTGIPPDLEDLCVRLLDPVPSGRPGYAELIACLAPGVGQTAQGARATYPSSGTALIGRERELAQLEDAFQRSQAGVLTCVSLHGDPGVGKSSLLRAFVEPLHARGAAALLGRCYERESVPYKALDDLMDALERYLLQVPSQTARELIPPGIRDLTHLFPVLKLNAELLSEVPEPPLPLEPLNGRQRAVDALRELLRRIARNTSVVLCLDDLQWGDVDSARFLAELLSSDAPPLLLILSYRSREAQDSPFLLELERLLAASAWSQTHHKLQVGPLPTEAATRLAMHRLGASTPEARQQAEHIARESRGNPFFIEELAHQEPASLSGAAPGPGSTDGAALGDVLWRRISQLPDEARRLLELLAVAGRPTGQDLLLDALGDARAPLSSVVLLRAHNLLRIHAGERATLDVSHDRIRESVVGHLEGTRRTGHHRRLAEVLEARPDADPQLLAVHHHAAGALRKAALHAFRAAERANQALAFHRAAELFGSALEWSGGAPEAELGDLRSLKLRRAEALANAGRGAEAAPLFLEVAGLGGTPEALLELQRRAIENYMLSGHIDEGVALLRPMLSRVKLSHAESSRGVLASFIWQMVRLRLRGMEFRERQQTLSAEQLLRMDLGWSLGKALASVQWIRAACFQLQSLRLALDSGEPSRISRSLIAFGPILIWEGTRSSVDKGSRLLGQGTELAQRLRNPALIGFAEVYQAAHSLVLGEWSSGLTHVDTGMRLLREHGVDVVWETNVGRFLGCQLLDSRRGMRELGRRAAEWHRVATELGDAYSRVMATFFASYHMVARDEAEPAHERAREALSGWSRLGAIQQGYTALRRCQADLYLGRYAQAWTRLAEIWPTLVSGQLTRAQICRIEFQSLRAQIALGVAQEDARRRHGMLRKVEQDATRLEREIRRDAPFLAALLRAGVARQRGQLDEALARLSVAIEGFQASDMPVFAASARLWKGELVGGDEGRALVREATAALEAEDIKQPRKWAAMLAPGFGR